MKIQLQKLACLGLWAIGTMALSSCNSPSPTPSPSPPSQIKAPSSTASAPVADAADSAAAPQRKPPAGMGNAIGRVLFDGKGAPGIEVQLCENLGFIGGCGGRTYQGKTNKDGFYIIDKVKPGEYAVAVRVFDTNKFIYPTAGVLSAAKFKVQKGESLSVRTVNLWKLNLQIISPKKGTTVKTDNPKLSWKAYPNADSYKVMVRAKQGAGTTETMETSETSTTSEKSLLNGEYQWQVEAFNAEGTKIAETAENSTFKITGQAGSNTVELLSPKLNASVGGAGLTLRWKAHPQAEQYQVYLKGVKAKDSVLSFESVNGTSYKLSAPLPADQYFWSVNAIKGGDKVAGSELQQFAVK